MSRKYFICYDHDTTQYICVSPEERYIELIDPENRMVPISRINYWPDAEHLLADIYQPISRKIYLSARLSLLSRYSCKRRHRAVA